MTTVEEQVNVDESFKNWEKARRRGRICAGLMVIGAAVIFFLKEYGVAIPEWVFTWQILVIGLGLISGVKCGFRGLMWIVVMAVGGIFLASEFFPMLTFAKFKVPLILLLLGLVILFKPRHKHKHFGHYKYKHGAKCGYDERNHWNVGSYSDVKASSDDFVMIHNVFAGTKKNIISKEFKGGDIRNTFGGCEINLMQADIAGEAVITVNQHFGGIKLIVPAHWVVKSEVVCMFGSVEDERPNANMTGSDSTKVLVLKGNIFMSGVEIVSY